MIFDSSALALQGTVAQAGGGGFGSTAIFIVLMIGIFYLMLWRPQSKQAKERKSMLAALKKGDVVVTTGGIVARIHSVAAKFLVLEIARDVRIRVLPDSIASKAPEGFLEEPETKQEAKPSEGKSEKGEAKSSKDKDSEK
jgi:preprotein translocase subunit YajC